MEDRPAIIIHRIRRQAQAAIRRGEQLDPRIIVAICRGEKV